MLSGLAICAAVTAVIAGITGAWSPCGFSMVETIGTALGDARKAATLTASMTFALGAGAGGVVTFGGLALVGHLLDPLASGLREALGAAVALAAAMADWRGVRIAPQIRRQVPERWRWTTPLPLACGLYGVLLGLAFTTFVLSFAVWALAGVSFAAGDPTLGMLIGLAFGLGRAAPVLWMAPGFHSGEGARRLDRMAAEPRMWLGLRRLDAMGLSLCALFLSGASATATVLPSATDPSAAGGALAWQEINGPGELRLLSGQTRTVPGTHPALGGSAIAWQAAGQITVADAASMTPKATFPVLDANALAVSDDWIVYRGSGASGGESLVGISLLSPSQRLYIGGSKLAGEVGRPALDGSKVVFTLDTPQRSVIELVDLATGARHVVRSSGTGAVLLNPSTLGGRLLYERVDRCRQELRIGALDAARNDRVLVSLASTVRRDPGYQPGYEHAYNTASVCPNRAAGPGAREQLGPTALSSSAVYFTSIPRNTEDARILTKPR